MRTMIGEHGREQELYMGSYAIHVNGLAYSIDSADPEKPLLYVLRELGLTAAKFGCGLGQCGACTVWIDGQSFPSCMIPIAELKSRRVTTLEGLGSGSHPVQAAFIEEQVPQCGYCTSGMIMRAAALLAQKAKPTEDDIRAALDGNLCRCGTHIRAIRAVMRAAGQGG